MSGPGKHMDTWCEKYGNSTPTFSAGNTTYSSPGFSGGGGIFGGAGSFSSGGSGGGGGGGW